MKCERRQSVAKTDEWASWFASNRPSLSQSWPAAGDKMSSYMAVALLEPEASTPVEVALTHGQREVIVTIRIVMAFLSLFGSLFVIGCMIKFKKFQGPQRLIMILTLCNMGDAISSLLSFGTFSHESDRYCTPFLLFLHLAHAISSFLA